MGIKISELDTGVAARDDLIPVTQADLVTRKISLSQALQVAGNGKGPAFSYTGDQLTSITYDDGSVKTFTYSGDVLTRIDFAVAGGDTIRKDFNYTGDTLTSIDETIV